jgi:protein-S-isoprenylcysteine O-methyltransferase Ste14
LEQVEPFLRRQRLDSPPSTSLTEYERITIRYFFVKLIFLPMMISFFYGTFQHLLGNLPWQASAGTAQYYRHLYIVLFNILMLIDIGWFATGISMETKRFSPIKMVDPYASGWLVTLACYPPLVYITGQYFSWQPPEFPTLFQADVAKYFMIAGLLLYTFYVLADISFGLKTGNLVYRGLVDKGPYRVIRHPMYASKNIAWCLFTVPAINFHFVTHALPFARSVHIPMLAANWGMVAPLLAWVTIYAMRGITEERYLLAFPEYQEYCKRVRYRFIPGVL